MQYILITGVSTGIGYATAKYLLEKGYFVFGSVRNPEHATGLSKQFGERFHPLVFDLNDAQAIEEARKTVEAKLEGQLLTALINNAGIAVYGPMLFVPAEQIRKQFEVNVFGTVQVIQTFAGLLGATLPRHKQPGKIINISSMSGKHTAPFLGPYCASKHALESITDACRHELSAFGIRVIAVRPGPIKSDLWEKVQDELEAYQNTMYAPAIEEMQQILSDEKSKALDAEKVAVRIHKILRNNNPSRSYVIAPSVLHKIAFMYLPNAFMDWVYALYLKKVLKG